MDRRTFLAGAAVAAVPVAPTLAAPAMSLRDQAIWHMEQLERLTIESGAKRAVVYLTGLSYSDTSSRSFILSSGEELWDEQGMFRA